MKKKTFKKMIKTKKKKVVFFQKKMVVCFRFKKNEEKADKKNMFVNCKFVFLHKLPTTNMKIMAHILFYNKKNISILLISRIIFIY